MTDLTDRMRTCAAHILATYNNPYDGKQLALHDAADLLIEAANMLDGLVVPLPPGEPSIEDRPMEVIPQSAAPSPDLWVAPGGPLPGLTRSGTISPRACPKCDSRATKTVYRQGNSLVLECPVCGHAWKRA